MKRLLLAFGILGIPALAHADFQRLELDALSSPEKAEETAQIINNNFSNFWATKLDISTPAASGPDRYVSDLLNPDMADVNAFIIMDNADSLWREKVDFNGVYSPGGCSIQIENLLDPNEIEDNIMAINQLFDEIDTAKVNSQ